VALALLAPVSAKTLTYWIEPCAPNGSTCRAEDAELAEWALDAWRRSSGGALIFERTTQRDRALLRFQWATGRNGLYGEARRILVNGERGAEIHVRPDLTHLGPEMSLIGSKDPLFREAIVYLTCLHESGHALGLPHTAKFDDIMYSFQYGGDIVEYFQRYRRRLSQRTDIRDNSGISEDDQRRLKVVVSQ